MRRRHWTLALAALPLAACTSAPEPTPTSTTARPAPALRLVAFDSCTELHADLRAATKESVEPWGLPGGPGVAMPAAAMAASDGVRAQKAAPPAAPAYSGTNVHEQGVDEPDIVKTDGRRIVTLDRGELRVVDAASHTETGRVSIGGESVGDAELLLAGDRAVVLVRGDYFVYQGKGDVALYAPPLTGKPRVILVDLAGTPRVISRYEGEGMLIDARQTGTVARVVLRNNPKIKFPILNKTGPTNETAMLRNNRKAIDAAPVDAWLPEWQITTGSATTRGKLPCSAVSRPAKYSGAAMLTVLTFDLAAPALTDGSPVSVVADGETVYGTTDSLYVASQRPWRRDDVGRSAPPEGTDIYRFALPATGRPVYTAGGTVPGQLLNQYAMSEWDGHLRIATTDPNGDASTVRVLRERDGRLAEVGKVGGLGKGERIYSVRFIGPRGYVVTFRQTDPLYSVDLSDPAEPRVTGELKITGYSAHLQPVDENRLIGIGQEGTEDGRATGTQISLFDVSDPAAPRRLAQHFVRGAYSEAEYDPHALLWWPATGLLVAPVSDHRNGGSALALHLTRDSLRAVGRLDVPGEEFAPIRRSLVIGDELWLLSDAGLLASNLSTLDRTGWVPLR